MASSNNDSGLKIGLICLGMYSVLFTGLWYKYWDENSRNQQLRVAADNQASEAKKQAADLQGTNTDALALLGGPNSFPESKEQILKAMNVQGVNTPKQTVLATLDAMRSSLDSQVKENGALKADLASTIDKLQKLEQVMQNRVDKHDESQKTSEGQLVALQKSRDEVMQDKDKQITGLQEDYRREQIEKETIRENADKTEKTLKAQIAQLSNIVDNQKQKLEDLQKVSFERADGEVVRMDANLGLVYINLGELDHLRPQINFSVYSKDHRGIGRQARDIKANIEVTRILGPHLAECRILTQDRTRPVADGDPIYSPIWAGGRTEYFAFVGLIDFDKDGKSDRETLHRLLKTAGAEIDLEVADDGVRNPSDATLTTRTKFLVLGQVPDPSQFPGNDVRKDRALAIGQQQKMLESEARLAGVRIVQLADFMAYMGFQSQLKSYIPGQVDKFILQQGARDKSVRSDEVNGQPAARMKQLEKLKEAELGIPK